MTPWSETDLSSDDPTIEDDDFDDWDDEDEEGPDELEFGEDNLGHWGEDDADEGTGW